MDVVWQNLGYILGGARATIELAVPSTLLAVLIGCIAGIARLYAPLPLRVACVAYIEVFRGTPVLVQMFFIFFGLPMLMGWNASAYVAATVALVLNNGAYFAEIVRGGLQSIPREQWTAGYALGMRSPQILASIVVPQALRRVLPPAVGQFTILVKDTSIASAIGYFEMTRAGQHVVERTLASFQVFTLVGMLFFAVCFAGTRLSRRLEQRLVPEHAKGTAWRYVLGAR